MSCSILGTFFNYAEQLDREASSLSRDLPYDEAHLRTNHARVDWQTFRTICERFRELCGDDPQACYHAGRKTWELGGFGIMNLLISLVPNSAHAIYKGAQKQIRLQFTVLNVEYTYLSKTSCELRYRFDPGYEAFPELNDVATGLCETAAALGGSYPAEAERVMTEDGFILKLEWPPRPNIFKRIYSVTLGRLLSFREASAELGRSFTLLEAQLAESQDLSRRLETLLAIGKTVEQGLDLQELTRRFSDELAARTRIRICSVALESGHRFGDERWAEVVAAAEEADESDDRFVPLDGASELLEAGEEARSKRLVGAEGPAGTVVLAGASGTFEAVDRLLLVDALSRLARALENAARHEELEEYRRELEQKVEARTAELREYTGRLEETNAKLTEIDRAKRRFFTHLTHELKNPMTLLSSSMDALERKIVRDGAALPEERRAPLTDLVSIGRMNVSRLALAVDDLLDLALLEESRLQPRWTLVDVVELGRGLVREIAPWGATRSVAVELAGDVDAVVQTRGDQRLLNKLLLNLVSNAIKFSPPEEAVTLNVVREDGRVRLEVMDRGPGIPEADRDRIFQPFEQTMDGKLTRTERGIGVGLSIAREIAQVHEGELSVVDREGGGSIFRFLLPIRSLDAPHVVMRPEEAGEAAEAPALRASTSWKELQAPEVRQSMIPDVEDMITAQFGTTRAFEPEAPLRHLPEPGAPASGSPQQNDAASLSWPDEGRRTVLLVDDEADILRTVGEMLEEDFDVMLANSADAALELLEDRIPDAIVSDVAMPGMSGLELCQILRQQPSTRNTPVLLLTAFGDLRDKLRGFAFGADDYITKPFQHPELLARIKTQLRLRELMAENVAYSNTAVIGTMAAGFAHEMKNPLNILLNALRPVKDLLADEGTELETIEQLLDLALESGDRLHNLARSLDRLLAHSSRPVPVDIAQFAQDTLSARDARMEAAVEATVDCDIPLPVLVPKNQLSLILGNLVDNGIDAIKEKGTGGHVTIEGRLESGTLVIVVRDDGAGMSREQLARALSLFYTTKLPDKGSGVGLAVVKQLLQTLDGNITLESAPGKGTTATVRIPVHEDRVSAGAGEASPEAATPVSPRA